jgi:hypothetical protein
LKPPSCMPPADYVNYYFKKQNDGWNYINPPEFAPGPPLLPLPPGPTLDQLQLIGTENSSKRLRTLKGTQVEIQTQDDGNSTLETQIKKLLRDAQWNVVKITPNMQGDFGNVIMIDAPPVYHDATRALLDELITNNGITADSRYDQLSQPPLIIRVPLKMRKIMLSGWDQILPADEGKYQLRVWPAHDSNAEELLSAMIPDKKERDALTVGEKFYLYCIARWSFTYLSDFGHQYTEKFPGPDINPTYGQDAMDQAMRSLEAKRFITTHRFENWPFLTDDYRNRAEEWFAKHPNVSRQRPT